MPDDAGGERPETAAEPGTTRTTSPDELERASENVLEGWPTSPASGSPEVSGLAGDEPVRDEEVADSSEPMSFDRERDDGAALDGDPPASPAFDGDRPETSSEHAPGSLAVPPGYPVLEGRPSGGRRAVGIVVSRFNGEITGRLLRAALDELGERGVDQGSITVMPVPGAFELPLAAMALAKTRRFACIVALGCVIRGDTHHFGYIAGEAASGLQLAAIETGVPVSFGVLTLERLDQAEARIDKGAEAVRTALEMADLFANLRAAAAR